MSVSEVVTVPRIAFASYKGGAGRTHALVSIANILARTGEHVLVIDMDVDAPGITSLVGHPYSTIRERGDDRPRSGLVSWALEHAGDPERLIDHTAPVEGVPGAGTLRVLPAGQVDESYAAAIASLEWAALLLPASAEDTRSPLAIQIESGLDTLIRQLEGKAPTVVLIDVRAGVGPLAGTLLLDVADTIVYFMTGDEDAMRIYRRVASAARARGRAIQPVFSRLPHYLPEAVSIVKARIEEHLVDESDESESDEIIFLRGAPGWESSSEPAIPHDHEVSSEVNATFPDAVSDLATDHVNLLLKLMPTTRRPSEDVDPKGAALFDPATLERTLSYKIFRLLDGQILNLDDRQPNVSLRTVTINQMFDGIFDEMVEMLPSVRLDVLKDAFRRVGSALSEATIRAALGPDGTAGTVVRDAFRSSGRKAGDDFADSLGRLFDVAADPDQEPKPPMSAAERMRVWCVFDSTVGFGQFSSDDDADGVIVVRVHEPFMTGGGGGGFVFEGYVLTVMEKLLQDRYTVVAEWDDDTGDLVATATPKPAPGTA